MAASKIRFSDIKSGASPSKQAKVTPRKLKDPINFQSAIEQLKSGSNTNHLKVRIVHLADGTISTRWNPRSPLIVAILIDIHGNIIRGYSFNQKRVALIRNVIHVGDIVYIHNAEIEPSNKDLTWVPNDVQLKFQDATQFQIAEPDPSFPQLQWSFKTIQELQEEETDEIIDMLAYAQNETEQPGRFPNTTDRFISLLDSSAYEITLDITKLATTPILIPSCLVIKGIKQVLQDNGSFELTAFYDTIIKAAPNEHPNTVEIMDWINAPPEENIIPSASSSATG